MIFAAFTEIASGFHHSGLSILPLLCHLHSDLSSWFLLPFLQPGHKYKPWLLGWALQRLGTHSPSCCSFRSSPWVWRQKQCAICWHLGVLHIKSLALLCLSLVIPVLILSPQLFFLTEFHWMAVGQSWQKSNRF